MTLQSRPRGSCAQKQRGRGKRHPATAAFWGIRDWTLLTLLRNTPKDSLGPESRAGRRPAPVLAACGRVTHWVPKAGQRGDLLPFLLHVAECCAQLLTRVWPSLTPWTAACRAPLSTGFSRQEYWSGISFNWHCHFLLQGIFPTHGSNPHLLLGRRILYH